MTKKNDTSLKDIGNYRLVTKETPAKMKVPFYDESGLSLIARMRLYGKARNLSALSYLFFKAKISMLQKLAYGCPFNSLRVSLHRMRGVRIGHEVYIGKRVFIDNLYPDFIKINNKVHLHTESMIIAHFNPSQSFQNIFEAKADPVEIKEGAIVGIRSIIMPGITVGEYSMITAGSVVTKNVQPYTLVQGNPAKKILDYQNLLK